MITEIIFGPPGTGKTTQLLSIVEERLAAGVEPERIAFLSFTKKAATEAVERAIQKFSLSKSRFIFFRTIHSLCFSTLGLSSADVFDGKKILEFGDWIGTRMTGKVNFEEGSTFGTLPGDRALFMCNLARLRRINVREMYLNDNDGLPWLLIDRINRGLQEFKKHHHLVDYTDMLERFTESSWRSDLDTLIVDEAQDLSPLQWEVIGRIATSARRLVVAGDDDQAIYRWAGAQSDHMSRIRGDTRVLGQSYRVPRRVQNLARDVISRIHQRVEKQWRSRDDEGRVVRVAKIEQIDTSSEDILVLARNFTYLSEVQSMLRQRGIPYSYRGTPAIPVELVEAVTNWERLRTGSRLDVDLIRPILAFVGSGMDAKRKRLHGVTGEIGLSDLIDKHGLTTTAIWHEAMDRLPRSEKMFMLAARRNGEKLRVSPRIRLSTIHGSKGGQGDHVVLLTDMAPRTSRERQKNPDDETRVWYVGVTRTINTLTVVDPSSSQFFSL